MGTSVHLRAYAARACPPVHITWNAAGAASLAEPHVNETSDRPCYGSVITDVIVTIGNGENIVHVQAAHVGFNETRNVTLYFYGTGKFTYF